MDSWKTLKTMLINEIWPKIFKAFSKPEIKAISKTFQSNGKNPIHIKIKYSLEYTFFNIAFAFIAKL